MRVQRSGAVPSVPSRTNVTVATESRSGWAALFRDAFNQSRNAMVLLDDERRHVEVNGAYVQLLGYRPSALLGRPISDLRADGAVASADEWRAALRQKQFTGVAELACADGGRVTVEFAGHPEAVTGRNLVLFVALRVARVGRLREDRVAPSDRPALSIRELEVVEQLALGLSGPEVADELRIAHNTVRTHVQNAMTKLGTRSRAQLVASTLGDGLYWRDDTELAQPQYRRISATQ